MEYKIREKLFGANKASAIGTSLTLNDTVKYPINKLTIDGVCKQETTTGKQLLDYDNFTNIGQLTKINPYGFKVTGTNAWMSGNFTIDLKANTKYTFKCLFNQIDAMSTIEVSIREESGKIIKDLISSKKNGTLIGSFTTEAITNITFHLYSNLSATPKTTTCDFTYLQIVEGEFTNETMSDFEPFTGNQPSPSPDYPQDIKTITGNLKLTSCGKNFIPLNSFFNNNYFILTNDLVTQKNQISASWAWTYNNAIFKFKIVKGTYTLTYFADILSTSTSAQFMIIDINNNIVATSQAKQTFDKGSISFTIDKDLEIGIVAKMYDGAWRFQLEKGTTATEYEPYQGSSLNITIPENEFVGKLDDTYKDTLNVVYKEDGNYHLILNKMIGKVVLDGSENWTLSSSGFILGTGEVYKHFKYRNINILDGFCNYFVVDKSSTTWTKINCCGWNTGGVFWIRDDHKLASTTDDFKSWLSTHNTEVYYALATPYEVDLGIVDTLLSYDNITNVISDSDLYPVINVKYYKGLLDISNYEFSIKEV